MNPRASSGLKKRCKHRGTEFTSSAQPIKPNLRVRCPRVVEASAEAQALREGGLKYVYDRALNLLPAFYADGSGQFL